jgi:hypothetical protein
MPKRNDLLLSRREGLQDAGGFVAHAPFDDGVHWRADRAIFDQIAECRIAFAAHRHFKRQRVAQDGFQLLHLFDWNVHAPADFVVSLLHCKSALQELQAYGVRCIATSQNIDTDESNSAARFLLHILMAAACQNIMFLPQVIRGSLGLSRSANR